MLIRSVVLITSRFAMLNTTVHDESSHAGMLISRVAVMLSGYSVSVNAAPLHDGPPP